MMISRMTAFLECGTEEDGKDSLYRPGTIEYLIADSQRFHESGGVNTFRRIARGKGINGPDDDILLMRVRIQGNDAQLALPFSFGRLEPHSERIAQPEFKTLVPLYGPLLYCCHVKPH
jgi:hypothetical protein